jgi:hypothetical protein
MTIRLPSNTDLKGNNDYSKVLAAAFGCNNGWQQVGFYPFMILLRRKTALDH